MKISIVGTGNVAASLVSAFCRNEHDVISIHGRNKQALEGLSAKSNALGLAIQTEIPKETDVVIIAVSDDSIPSVSKKLTLASTKTIISHTSGSKGIRSLAHRNNANPIGIFYPLQTIRKEAKLDFTNIPICVNAQDENTLKVLFKLGMSISSNVVELNDEDRLKAHIAAVIINNFTNHIVSSAFDFLKDNDIPINIVQPLLQETVDKLLKSEPDTAQTGPAKRGDVKVIKEHLKVLKDSPLLDIYKTMSDSIINKYHKS